MRGYAIGMKKSMLLVAAITTATLTGCSQIVKTGANIFMGVSETYMVPPMLTMDDPDMACNSGTALSPLMDATKYMGADPTKLAVLTYAGAALCAEQRALEQELTYLRAARTGNVEAAQDARIAQKRIATEAAKRQYAAYQMFAESYQRRYKITLGDNNKCPKMKTDLDKLVYMMGLISGLQAVTNDVAGGGTLNVPRDIAAIVERGMMCLDNQQFWGVPMATRAAIWTLLPGASEGKPDPYQTMKDSARLGEASGVRLSHAIYAIAAQASGKDELLRDAIKTYGNTIDKTAVSRKYALIDAFGGTIVRTVADRYWTEKTGSRAPENGMTQFWDEKPAGEEAINIDDLMK